MFPGMREEEIDSSRNQLTLPESHFINLLGKAKWKMLDIFWKQKKCNQKQRQNKNGQVDWRKSVKEKKQV